MSNSRKIKKLLYVSSAILAGFAILIFAVFALAPKSSPEYEKYSNVEEFAKCISEKGGKMYGASWCPHCQNQKRNFGEAFKFINYIECGDNPEKCTSAGVSGLPTWVFPAGRIQGDQDLETLSSVSACPLILKSAAQR